MPYKDRKAYFEEYRHRPETILRTKVWREENIEKLKQKQREYQQRPITKTRRKVLGKEYRQEHKGEIRRKAAEFYQKNQEKIKRRVREYKNSPEIRERVRQRNGRPEVKKRKKLYMKVWRIKNKEHEKEYWLRLEVRKRKKEWAQTPRVKAKNRQYYFDNLERIKIRSGDYYKNNHTKIRVRVRDYNKTKEGKEARRKNLKKRMETDSSFKVLCDLRHRFNKVIQLYSKTGKIMSSKKYGIDYEAIIEYLKPFPKDLSKYHIDHIIALSLFDFNNPKHIKKAFAPENHQWLTTQQNLEKGNRLVMPHYK